MCATRRADIKQSYDNTYMYVEYNVYAIHKSFRPITWELEFHCGNSRLFGSRGKRMRSLTLVFDHISHEI